MTAEEIIALLGLAPHRREGGFFREIYRADEGVAAPALPARYGGPRALSTAIYYLLTPHAFSPMHRLLSDEIFHFYLGDPVELLLLEPGAAGRTMVLGTDLAAGMRPQGIVSRGVWQGARLVAGGACALLGTTVAPGFDYADYADGERDALIAAWPAHAELIRALTPSPATA